MTPTVKTRERHVGKNWVIVKLQNGTVKAWHDYGMAWGSPVYTVLGYATNSSHRDAIRKGRQRLWYPPAPLNKEGTHDNTTG